MQSVFGVVNLKPILFFSKQKSEPEILFYYKVEKIRLNAGIALENFNCVWRTNR